MNIWKTPASTPTLASVMLISYFYNKNVHNSNNFVSYPKVGGTGNVILFPFSLTIRHDLFFGGMTICESTNFKIIRVLKYKIKISSTRVQHKVGSRDEMRWSPYIIGPWVARVPADNAWRTITRADEMKRNGWDEDGEMVEWNLWKGKTGETPWKTYPDPVSSTTKPTWRDRDANSGPQRREASV